MRLTLTTILICIYSISFGQSKDVLKIIDSLQKRKVDTIIHYFQKCSMVFEELKEYVVWKENLSTKIMIYSYNNLGNEKDQYTFKTINVDTIFSYLNKHADKINNEQIFPLVGKLHIGDTIVYSTMEHLHPCILAIVGRLTNNFYATIKAQ